MAGAKGGRAGGTLRNATMLEVVCRDLLPRHSDCWWERQQSEPPCLVAADQSGLAGLTHRSDALGPAEGLAALHTAAGVPSRGGPADLLRTLPTSLAHKLHGPASPSPRR